MRHLVVLLLISCLSYSSSKGQSTTRSELIRSQLENLSEDIPQLQNKVTFSVSEVSLYEFIRALAINNKINIDIDPKINTTIAVNFTNVSVLDLLVYLSEQYDLDLFTTGSIISIVKYQAVPEPPTPIIPKVPIVSVDSIRQRLNYDLQNDTLYLVLKQITNTSGVNIILPQTLRSTLVSGYVKDMNIKAALQELAYTNNLSFRIKDSDAYYIEEITAKPLLQNKDLTLPQGLVLKTNNRDTIVSIKANNVPIRDVLSAVAAQLNINYFIFSDIKGNTDLKAEYIDFRTFLRYLFNATDYTYKVSKGVYLIGDRKLEEIRTTEVYPLRYRTVTKLIEQIPIELKKGLELIAINDLNSVVISGSNPAIIELKNFLQQIDKIVPVINIELTILDIRRSHSVATGIMAGIDSLKRSSSYSSVFPNLDVNLNSGAINSIVDGINGTGIVNLGKVTPNFYVSLKASEDNGNLKIRSTPKLSTLNGNEAEMTIGETRYYAEQTTNVITTQSTTTVNARVFKELQANFAIIIKPVVSGDEQITLDISVEQSTFTEQFTKDGPYGRLTRSFKSSVRVKNNEMILLGGLEEKNINDAGQGVPVLSRIPVLKWLFSSRSNSTKKSKLAILIHPTVYY